MRAAIFLAASWLIAYIAPAAGETKEPLVIYAYDSFFAGEPRRSLGREIEARTGHPVSWVIVGDAGQVVSRYQLDFRAGRARAHLLVGIDEATLPAVAETVTDLDEKKVPSLSAIEPWLRRAPKLAPYHYGVQAFVVDTAKLPESEWPRRWDDLLKPALKKKLLLQDPRTSTAGLGLLMASRQVWGEKFAEKWKGLRGQWLTLAPGWSQAYALFQRGEAPLVWSYTTSQAYHQLAKDPSVRYRALVFEEGNPVQIEGAVVPAVVPGGVSMQRAAYLAVEALLSGKIQAEIPRAQWMIPARRRTPLPWTGRVPGVPEPRAILSVPTEKDSARETLRLWSDAIR